MTVFLFLQPYRWIRELIEEVLNKPGERKKRQSPSEMADKGNDLTIESIIELATSCKKNGEKFQSLYNGEYESLGYCSHSEADLAFCSYLAFWTNLDPEKMDEIFRKSKLMRTKWDEFHGTKTYGQITIEKALERDNNGFVGSKRYDKKKSTQRNNSSYFVIKKSGKKVRRESLSKREMVRRGLQDHLSGRPCSSSVIVRFLEKDSGASESLIYNVRKSLGIISRRIVDRDLTHKVTYWYFPEDENLLEQLI